MAELYVLAAGCNHRRLSTLCAQSGYFSMTKATP
jgi:hypothetical protein